MGLFNLVSDFSPTGDQPRAIEYLTKGVLNNEKHQVLLGVTGSARPLPWPILLQGLKNQA